MALNLMCGAASEERVGITSNWRLIEIENMQDVVAESKRNRQHLFILDTNGAVNTYFEEFGTIKDFTREMVQVAVCSESTQIDVLDASLKSLGDSLRRASQEGQPFLINLGMLKPDFKKVYTHTTSFPSKSIFKWQPNESNKSGLS